MNTLITTYYDNPGYLQIFIENNFNRDYFSNLIVVDDASQKYPAKDVLQEFDTENITLYRLKEDVGFNSHAARNLAAVMCKTEWATFLDLDHVFLPFALERIQETIDYEENEYVKIAENQYTIPVKYFLMVGGYDERFNGMRWGDFHLENKLMKVFSGMELRAGKAVVQKNYTHIPDQIIEYKQFEKSLTISDNPLDWHKHDIITFEWKKICL